MLEIHPSAVIHAAAELGADCTVGPYSVIGAGVKIGRGTRIASHVVIEGQTTIGEENQIFQFASVGAVPQDLKYQGEESRLIIGDRNIIREYVTLQPGTQGGGMQTVIGNGNLFMACSHVGHDGMIGDMNVFANCCAMAGHVSVGHKVTIGGMAGIHQFVRIGDLAFIGAGSMVSKDVPPYCMAHGDHAVLIGLNHIGLQRAGFSTEQIMQLRKIFRRVFLSEGRFSERVSGARELAEGLEAAQAFLEFLDAQSPGSSRGITNARRAGAKSDAHEANG